MTANVYLFGCEQNDSRSSERVLLTCSEKVGHGPKTRLKNGHVLNSGGILTF